MMECVLISTSIHSPREKSEHLVLGLSGSGATLERRVEVTSKCKEDDVNMTDLNVSVRWYSQQSQGQG